MPPLHTTAACSLRLLFIDGPSRHCLLDSDKFNARTELVTFQDSLSPPNTTTVCRCCCCPERDDQERPRHDRNAILPEAEASHFHPILPSRPIRQGPDCHACSFSVMLMVPNDDCRIYEDRHCIIVRGSWVCCCCDALMGVDWKQD